MDRFSRAVAGCIAAAWSVVLAGCGDFGFLAVNAPNSLGAYDRKSNQAYGEDARQRLDVYSPKGEAKGPIVIFFYGGSFTDGQRSDYAFVGAALAEHGYITVIPDYRLYPQIRFPGFIDDGASAVAWVQQHAVELGGDPHRLVLMGHSAGAYIAALLALDRSYLERAGVRPHSIAALVGLSGPYALDPNTDTLHEIFTKPYTLSDWQPVHFANREAPPTLLIHGMKDDLVYCSHTQELATALRSHGAYVDTKLYPKRGHADTIASFSLVARWRTPAFKQTLNFLNRITGAVTSDASLQDTQQPASDMQYCAHLVDGNNS